MEEIDMKDKMLRNVIIDAIGTLDTDENGKLVLNVETKDNVQSYDVLELLDEMKGTKVQLKSVAEM
jgi:hypothetical protein